MAIHTFFLNDQVHRAGYLSCIVSIKFEGSGSTVEGCTCTLN